ncbi:MAG TPA: anthrone oxygenase family protein [Kofleriaceae bacterium]
MISFTTLAVAIGCSLAGGVFFAFSTFVMPALARLPGAQGIAAMQSINATAINPWLLGVVFGAAAGCVGLAIASLRSVSETGAMLRLAGSVLYVFGTIAVTIACNIPRNNALASVPPDGRDAAGLWLRFVTEWTTWNHVRAAAAVAAAALLGLSLVASHRAC